MSRTDFTNREIIAMWAAHAEVSTTSFEQDGDFARKHLLNPAIFSMLGGVEGKRILDAGCGNGYLSRLLAHRGAIVTGVEPALIHLCEKAAGPEPKITYLEEDLSTLLEKKPELAKAFDVVIANMVLQDIPDCAGAMWNCVEALTDGGTFVFSIVHPCFEESAAEWREKGFVAVHDYFELKAIRQPRFGVRFHRPLSFYVNALVESGCNIVRVAEPRLDPDSQVQNLADLRDRHVPSFLVVQAIRARP